MTRKHKKFGRHRGNVLLYVGIGMVAFTGFTSLGIDVSHVRLVKNELQFAADASARYAVAGLATSVAQAKANAVSAAAACYADGSSVVVNSTNDVTFGTWSGGTFTVLTGAAQSTANAVQVVTHRTAAGGNAVSLTFAAILGMSSADVTVTSTAKYIPGSPAGLIGLSSITIHDNFFLGSYNSGTTTTPTQSTATSNAMLESNGVIGGHSADTVQGAVTLGPSGSINSITYSGTKTNQGSAITGPTVTTPVVSNPLSLSANQTVSSSATWPGGTYYFTSFTMNNSVTLSFSGPATIYLNGNATINDTDTITASGGAPANLVIYQASGDNFTAHDHFNMTAEYIGTGANFTIHDSGNIYGSVLAGTVLIHDNDNVFTDSAISGGGANSITIVK